MPTLRILIIFFSPLASWPNSYEDELANFAEFRSLSQVLSSKSKRSMWFTLVLQLGPYGIFFGVCGLHTFKSLLKLLDKSRASFGPFMHDKGHRSLVHPAHIRLSLLNTTKCTRKGHIHMHTSSCIMFHEYIEPS